MPNKRALKVFRTSAGFEDAYIAAPSQKAALEAWGARRNLFAQGVAELIKDPDLAKAALARPGEVLRVPRGTTAEHLAAAETSTRREKGQVEARHKAGTPQPRKKPKPRPSRDQLDEARDRMEQMRRDVQAGEADLVGQIERLKAELVQQKRKNAQEIARLQSAVDKEDRIYRKALAKWEG